MTDEHIFHLEGTIKVYRDNIKGIQEAKDVTYCIIDGIEEYSRMFGVELSLSIKEDESW